MSWYTLGRGITYISIYVYMYICNRTCALFTVTESVRTPGNRSWSLTPNTTYYCFFFLLFVLYVCIYVNNWIKFWWIMKHYVDYSLKNLCLPPMFCNLCGWTIYILCAVFDGESEIAESRMQWQNKYQIWQLLDNRKYYMEKYASELKPHSIEAPLRKAIFSSPLPHTETCWVSQIIFSSSLSTYSMCMI